MRLLIFIAAVLLVALLFSFANAAEMPDSAVTAINWQPVLEALVTGLSGLLLAVLTALGAMAVRWLNAKTGSAYAVELSMLGKNLDAGIVKAVSYAEQKARDRIGIQPAGPLLTTREDEVVKAASDYVTDRFADTLKKLGLEPDHVPDMVKARLPEVLGK